MIGSDIYFRYDNRDTSIDGTYVEDLLNEVYDLGNDEISVFVNSFS